MISVNKKHHVAFMLTTFARQVFRSEKTKWFNYQKQAATKMVNELTKSKKNDFYSLSKYGNQATNEVPFSSKYDSERIKAAIERVKDPEGTGSLEAALQLAVEKVFPKSDGLENLQKTLVFFIEQGITDVTEEIENNQERE